MTSWRPYWNFDLFENVPVTPSDLPQQHTNQTINHSFTDLKIETLQNMAEEEEEEET